MKAEIESFFAALTSELFLYVGIFFNLQNDILILYHFEGLHKFWDGFFFTIFPFLQPQTPEKTCLV